MRYDVFGLGNCVSRERVFREFESNAQSYANNFPKLFQYALGAEIRTAEGQRFLDFLSGAGSLNYGHNPPELKQGLLDYIGADFISSSLDLHTVAKLTFLETLNEVILKPRGLDHVVQFTGPTGANSVEAALKIARRATGRINIVAFTNGFHGVTNAALAATGNAYNRGASGVPLTGVTRMPYDGYLGDGIDTLNYFERMLNDPSSGLDLPAGVIVEAVQGEGGHRIASDSWLKRLEELCRSHGMILIADEIQTGCGRTGQFFGFEKSGIVPDIITLSKSLSGYGLPLAVCLIRRDLDLWKPGEHNGTFRGNNHAFVTATAALEIFWRDGEFEHMIEKRAAVLAQRLAAIRDDHPKVIAEVRGRGMMQGLLFRDPEQARRVTRIAFDNGLIAERVGSRDEVVKCMPPINIPIELLNEGLDILEAAVSASALESPVEGILIHGASA